MKVAREAPDPLYLQVKAALLGEITSGRYESNRRLPSERELALRFQVSRMTARQALLELAREGANLHPRRQRHLRRRGEDRPAPPRADQL